jgi:hypothetical protein
MTFGTVQAHIKLQVQKTFKDGFHIAESIQTLKTHDLTKEEPVRLTAKINSLMDEEELLKAKVEQDGMDFQYTAQLGLYYERVQELKTGMLKAYALIFSTYCSKTMQQRVMESPNFLYDTGTDPDKIPKIENNPVQLLIAIQSLMHDAV